MMNIMGLDSETLIGESNCKKFPEFVCEVRLSENKTNKLKERKIGDKIPYKKPSNKFG